MAKIIRVLARVAVILAFIVVILGAYTRLKDAGLGCPDWPGCYGHWKVPESAASILKADKLYPNTPVEPIKAWAEMTHRYAAGTLGLLILFIGLGSFFVHRKNRQHPVAIPLALIALVIFQAALGMWTVTLQLLPEVVMGHLLGGMTILAFLWWLNLKLSRGYHLEAAVPARSFRPWAVLGLIIIVGQIALGGWTSANYAGLACPTFPLCHGQWLPFAQMHRAFNFLMPVGADFQGGVLDNIARASIQVMHRLGGLITGLYWIWLTLWILISGRSNLLRKVAGLILVLLLAQITLGILNVVLLLPLGVAVAHNGTAALLLLSVVTLIYTLYAKPIDEH